MSHLHIPQEWLLSTVPGAGPVVVLLWEQCNILSEWQQDSFANTSSHGIPVGNLKRKEGKKGQPKLQEFSTSESCTLH